MCTLHAQAARPNGMNENKNNNKKNRKNEATETNFSLKKRPKTKTNVKWHKIE